MRKKVLLYTLIGSFFVVDTTAQDLEGIGKRISEKIKNSPLKISGNLLANGIFYRSGGRSARKPFTYFLQGTLNVGWLSFNMPITYSLSNQGSNLGYTLPFNFNRLSLHPKYKWIQGHIGNVSMTFSPNTLSGYQFAGGGLELTPEGPFRADLMVGRLQKPVADNDDPKTVPSFRRMGYGTKLGWKKEKYKLDLIIFYAKDDIGSIPEVPKNKNVTPKENLSVELGGEVVLAEHYTLKAAYTSSAMTRDLRASTTTEKGSGMATFLFNNRISTAYYGAFKAGVDAQIEKMKIGIGYERIDPGYETLGAYFFNNDVENITVNASRPLFKDMLNLSFNIGYQRNNLIKQKAQSTSRFVGAVNATLQATEKITLSGSYSNFSTYTNRNLNQFEDINDSDLTDEDLEALNFKQLSQNANINVNWILAQTDHNNQNFNLNYNLASSANEQAGIIRIGQVNNFHNVAAVYSIGFPTHDTDIATSLNYNYSDIGRDNSDTYGGAVQVGKKFFEKKLAVSLGMAYNTSKQQNIKNDVFNFRVNAGITVAKNHMFSLNAIQLFRRITGRPDLHELTLTLGYNYRFQIGGSKKKK